MKSTPSGATKIQVRFGNPDSISDPTKLFEEILGVMKMVFGWLLIRRSSRQPFHAIAQAVVYFLFGKVLVKLERRIASAG